MYGRRQFDGEFHRLGIGDGTELELCHVRCLTFVRLKHEVAVDDHAHWKPRPDRQRWLDVKITLNDFLSGLVQAIAGSTTERCDDIAIGASAGGRSKFAADAEQCRQQRGFEQGPPMIVDLILKAGITGGIGARLTLQHDRAAVRHDQAGPDQQHTRLPKRNLAIIDTYQPRPLWHEKETARGAIEHVLGNLGRER